MNPSLVWTNWLAYCAQVVVIVAAGGLLQILLRARQPRAHLIFCQLMLVLSLILPVVQPWHVRLILVPATPAATAQAPAAPVSVPQPANPSTVRWEDWLLIALAAGAAARGLWLAVGLWRLSRYRASAMPLYPLPQPIEAARDRTGAEALVCTSEAVDSPVTFGFLKPTILLPPTILEQPAETQFAIAVHEFLHVRRHDWLVTMIEEAAGALLWFHPAVWWLLAQIRLSREQVVDRAVVAYTQARDPYVHALLTMAGARPRLDLAPAPLFLRKRHLTQRVRSLLKEVSMSRQRLVSSYLSIAAVLVIAAWGSTVVFPLTGSAQVQVQAAVTDGAGVTVQPGGTILRRTAVRYPAEALSKGISGLVIAELTLSDEGAVTDARILSGPEELRRDVLQSVLQWRYVRNQSTPRVVQATFDFVVPLPPAAQRLQTAEEAIRAEGARQRYESIREAAQGSQAILESVDVSALPEPLQSTLRAKLSQFAGQPYTPELRAKIEEAVGQADSRLLYRLRTNPEPRRMSLVLTPDPSPAAAAEPASQASPPSTPGVQRIKVGGNVQEANLLNRVIPVYPPLAQAARISGLVRFDVLVGTDGHIIDATLVTGHPLLVPPAQEAIQQWVYRPTLLNGQPVEVATQVDVNFTLQ